jgi:hypothetical protein
VWDAEVLFILVIYLEISLEKVKLIKRKKFKWHKVTFVGFFLVLSKAAYVLMKKNNESFNLKCAACTVSVTVARTAEKPKNISDLHVPDLHAPDLHVPQLHVLEASIPVMIARMQLGPVS